MNYRIIYYLTLVVLVAPMVVFAQPTDDIDKSERASNYRVAVTDFSINDIANQLDDEEDFVAAIADAFETALVQSGRFTVVTRDELDTVLAEIALGKSGVINPEQAIEMGQLSGAELLVTGNITFNEQVTITINFINALTGEIDANANWQTDPDFDFTMVAQELCSQAGESYAPRGTIIATGARTFISLGSETGVGETRTGTLLRESLVAGRRFSEVIGDFVISSLGPEASAVQLNMKPGFQPEVGDVAMLDSYFDFDTSFSINTTPDISQQIFGSVFVEVSGDDIPALINIFTAEGELVSVVSPFEQREALVKGNYIATPYGDYTKPPAQIFSVQPGLTTTVSIDMNGVPKTEHTYAITHLLYSPDGEYLISAGGDGWILIRDAQDATLIKALDTKAEAFDGFATFLDVVISADGRYLATSTEGYGEPSKIIVWDMYDFSIVSEHNTIRDVSALAFSDGDMVEDMGAKEGTLYVVSDWNAALYHLDIATGDIIFEAEIENIEGIDASVVFHPQAGIFFTHESHTIYMYNLNTGDAMNAYEVRDINIVLLALNPERGWLAVGGDNGKVYLYDFIGKTVVRLRRGGYEVQALTFSPDGNYLVSGVRESYMWELDDFSFQRYFDSGSGVFITALAFSPDESALAVSTSLKTLNKFSVTP